MPMTSDAEMRNITTEHRIDTWAASQPVGLVFQRLHQIIKEGRDRTMLFIKYEDLCKSPQKELEKVYKYLELDYFDHDFNNIEQVTVEDDEVYGVFGDHNIKREIQYTNPDYNEILGNNPAK